jgi:hypothetical protein
MRISISSGQAPWIAEFLFESPLFCAIKINIEIKSEKAIEMRSECEKRNAMRHAANTAARLRIARC